MLLSKTVDKMPQLRVIGFYCFTFKSLVYVINNSHNLIKIEYLESWYLEKENVGVFQNVRDFMCLLSSGRETDLDLNDCYSWGIIEK